jgi:hypothetical protein
LIQPNGAAAARPFQVDRGIAIDRLVEGDVVDVEAGHAGRPISTRAW